MVTKERLIYWLAQVEHQTDERALVFHELLTSEIKRRNKAGRKPSDTQLPPLKERNGLAAKRYREGKRLKRALATDRKNLRNDAKVTKHRESIEDGSYKPEIVRGRRKKWSG